MSDYTTESDDHSDLDSECIDSLEDAGYESAEECSMFVPILLEEWAHWLAQEGFDPTYFPDIMNNLFQIGSLPRMASTIRKKMWFRATVSLVKWIVFKRLQAGEFGALDVVLRREMVRQGQLQTQWFLFGGPFCQIGKTFVAAVGTVVAAYYRTSHFVFTYTASSCVPDLQQKIVGYLGSPNDPNVCAYSVETFPSNGTKAKMQYIAGKAQNTTWVVSFNSPHQLETAAALRLTLSRAYGSCHPDARPLVTADEVDQIVRSKNRGQLMEKTFDAVLGMFDRKIRVNSKLKRDFLCGGIEDKLYRLAPVLGVVATTSTPVTFLWQFARDFRAFQWTLDGWTVPEGWTNYVGLQHYRARTIDDHVFAKSNKYLFDSQNISLEAINRAVALGRNQIVYIGNPYVKASDGLYEMVSELEVRVAQPGKLCYVIVHGSGRGIKIHGQEWVEYSNKNMTVEEALKEARQLIGDGTIFICGTPTMISRGISMVSELICSVPESGKFLCPPSLVILATPLGRSLEEYYQGLNRGTGDFLASLAFLGQVDELTMQPFVELVAAKADWLGCQAYPKYTLRVFDEYTGGRPIDQALISPKEVGDDFLAKFRDERTVGARSAKIRKCQGNVDVYCTTRRPVRQRPSRVRMSSKQPERSSQAPINRSVEGRNPGRFVAATKTTRSRQLLQALPFCWRDEDGAKVFDKKDLHAVLRDMADYDGWMDDNRDGGTTLYELHHDKEILEPFGRRSGKYKVTRKGMAYIAKLLNT